MAYLPIVSQFLKISYTIPLLCIGLLFFYLKAPLPWPDPLWPQKWTKILTEIVVIISLMSAGLKIGIRYSWKEWKPPLALIVITMPLFMLALYLISRYGLGFAAPIAILLAAITAPTDPVLASELQLKDHKKFDKNTGLRFVLTAEAGINDGLAFPFVFLAIMASKATTLADLDWWHWLSYYVIYKIVAGTIIGSIIGYVYSWSLIRMPKETQYEILNGFVTVSLTFVSYGIAEVCNGYGFLSVFFTGLMAQYFNTKRDDAHPDNEMILFIEETEKFLIVIWTVVFGGSLASGILQYTDIYGVLFSLLVVAVIRPLFGLLAMYGFSYSFKKKLAISFFGIRGIGSLFYLSYAVIEGNFTDYKPLYAILSYIILFSILIHGLTSHRVVNYFMKNDPG